MVSYQYSYLIGTIIILIIWLILFFSRKDTRKEMLIISIIFGISGLIVAPIYLTDWWHPLTITKTLIGIEDFLYGFAIAGIASVIYTLIFKKKVQIKKTNKKGKIKRNKNYIIITLILIISFFGSFYLLNLSSFHSSIIAFIIPLSIIWIKRKDLIVNSILTGILLVILSFFAYWTPELINPGWITSAWYLDKISGIQLLMVPIEDLIWIFLTGLYIGPLYEYWQEGRLINKK